jgi:hypothetical protein
MLLMHVGIIEKKTGCAHKNESIGRMSRNPHGSAMIARILLYLPALSYFTNRKTMVDHLLVLVPYL